MSEQNRANFLIRHQPINGTTEAQVMATAKDHYGKKFNEKMVLELVDLFKPLHVAITTGSEQEVQAAIANSLDEIHNLHRYALNQCTKNGYVSSASDIVGRNGAIASTTKEGH